MPKLLLNLLFALSFALLTSASLSAQVFTIPPSPGATFIGAFMLHVGIEADPNGGIRESRRPTADTYTLVGTFRNSGGRTEYVICSDSIRFLGGDSLINATPTYAFYDLLGRATVRQGAALGFAPPSTDDCNDPNLATKAYSEACVQRIGYGSMTRFIPCDRYTFSNRAYTICPTSDPSAPIITRVANNGGLACSGTGCDATCPPQSENGVLK